MNQWKKSGSQMWKDAEEASRRVEQWPAWKRGDLTRRDVSRKEPPPVEPIVESNEPRGEEQGVGGDDA